MYYLDIQINCIFLATQVYNLLMIDMYTEILQKKVKILKPISK